MLDFLKRKETSGAAEETACGMTAEAPAQDESKPDLVEYLKSLPDVEDPFAPFPEDEVINVPEEKNDSEHLADYIRMRSAHSELSSRKMLIAECEDDGVLLKQMLEDNAGKDICCVKGEKDEYYYSSLNMETNFAMIAMLVEEKDIPRTVAHMVRFNCKTYPASTPYRYFYQYPYHYTKQQLTRAIEILARDEQYADIVTTKAFNGVPYLFSTKYFSLRYGQALADSGEEEEVS